MGSVVVIVGGSYEIGIVVFLFGDVFDFIEWFTSKLIWFVVMVIGCLSLKCYMLLWASMLALFNRILPQVQMSHTHLEWYLFELLYSYGLSKVFLGGVSMSINKIKSVPLLN
jgi:hypothetical protein